MEKNNYQMYSELFDTITKGLRVKYEVVNGEESPYLIEAIFAETREDFELVKKFWSYSRSVGRDGPLANVKGEWDGPDWYFCTLSFEKFITERGTEASECVYELIGLKEKKEQFRKYCERFEERLA